MPNKMNLDVGYLKLQYREFQKYEVMNMSVVGGLPKKQNKKKHANTSYKASTHYSRTFLISDYY